MAENISRESESAKSEKEMLWEQKRKEIDEIKDGLDLGIDEHIKEAVTALNVYEFSTNQSCEGHLDKEEHGTTFPWVEIYALQPKDWRKSKGEKKEKLEEEWRIENLQQQKRMMDLFAEFYQDRQTPFDARLTFKNIGAFGGFRIQSFGGEVMKLLPLQEKEDKLKLYRKELDNFTQFLKEKFLNQ